MLKHIVFIKLKDIYSPEEKELILNEISFRLNELPNSIEQIQKLETGRNISTRPSAFDLSLIVDFNNEADLNIYQTHPKHNEVLSYLATIKLETAVVDYII